MKTPDIDAAVRGLNPHRTTDQVSDDAWAELSEAVTTADTAAAPVVTLHRRQPRRLALVAACTLLIAGVVAATVVNRPHQDQPQALSFTERGDKLVVRVVDPNADPARYNAEFKKMGLDVTVMAVPVSAPWVGRMVSFSGRNEKDMNQLRLLEPGEQCNGTLTAADPGCQEGLELPKNYDGKSDVQFGRAAKPGELYVHTSSSATDEGEVLAGLTVKNKTVDQVLPLVRARGVGKVDYRLDKGPTYQKPEQTPPGTWYVHSAQTFAEGEVTLYVDATPAK
jgi:hypothetical protein